MVNKFALGCPQAISYVFLTPELMHGIGALMP